MRNKIIRRARLVREIAGAAIAVIKLLQVIVEIVIQAANCDAYQLPQQV